MSHTCNGIKMSHFLSKLSICYVFFTLHKCHWCVNCCWFYYYYYFLSFLQHSTFNEKTEPQTTYCLYRHTRNSRYRLWLCIYLVSTAQQHFSSGHMENFREVNFLNCYFIQIDFTVRQKKKKKTNKKKNYWI
jgi:hypothetical protein